MSRRVVLWLGGLILAGAALAGCLALSRLPLLALLAFIPLAGWLLSKRFGREWLAHAGLGAAVTLAAAALLLGAPLMAALAALLFALATWDVTLFQAGPPPTVEMEAQHLRLLAGALALGALLAAAGALNPVKLPFGWLLVLLAGVLAGLSAVKR